jgi:hypothetical protein
MRTLPAIACLKETNNGPSDGNMAIVS